jgi:hypothetical protein
MMTTWEPQSTATAHQLVTTLDGQRYNRTWAWTLIIVHAVMALWLLCMLTSCGGTGGVSGEPLPTALVPEYEQVEACINMTAPQPNLSWDGMIPCQQRQMPCCLASYGYHHTPDGPYGAAGEYVAGTDVIVLPEDCNKAFKHEAIHYILWTRTGDPDANHTGPWWVCQ